MEVNEALRGLFLAVANETGGRVTAVTLSREAFDQYVAALGHSPAEVKSFTLHSPAGSVEVLRAES